MKWVITGGCGFIGRNLIQKLLASGGANLRVLDNFSVGSFSDIAGLSDDAELQHSQCDKILAVMYCSPDTKA